MSPDEVKDLFAKVGASASRLMGKDSAERSRAVGTFGIGVISYFLVCDEYEVQTRATGSEPIGLVFSRAMLDGETPAQIVTAERSDTGTTLRLRTRDERLFQLLVDRFPFWIRDVSGLTARLVPEGVPVAQGGLSRDVRAVDTVKPDWVEVAHIGPPTEFAVWNEFDGRAKVDVLYRGVHVDRLEVPGLWGIEGAIHVDPTYFRPKLNREGFIGDEMRSEVATFLRGAHPNALIAALKTLREDLDSNETSSWSLARWAAIWLAVPRGEGYEAASRAWDEEFASRPAFRLLRPSEGDEQEISITDLQGFAPEAIFVAPVNLAQSSAPVRQAVRALRARGNVVIQGIARDPSFLGQASWAAQTTADLLLAHFRTLLPELKQVEPLAEELIRQDSVAELFATSPRVLLVHLGIDAVPLVAISNEIWVNIDVEAGKSVVREVCDRNDGTLGLWVACLIHCPEQTVEVSRVVRAPTAEPRLGPVMRQHLRRFVA